MEILKKTKDLLASLVDVTEAGSKIARFKIEVANVAGSQQVTGMVRWRESVLYFRIETAISAGCLLPIRRPAGPRMRAICPAAYPSDCRRLRRALAERLEPGAPM